MVDCLTVRISLDAKRSSNPATSLLETQPCAFSIVAVLGPLNDLGLTT